MADGEEEEEAHDWRRSRAASPSARGSRRCCAYMYKMQTKCFTLCSFTEL
ncbi:hypothetical protein OsI_23437 [Oryza sativa Indica Group]|uniref:Uncharacterized protein n=1 Tax=Oryza sativa subsp. indica TaxID=39946 RepID=A2YE94_ORYSI|nr:hypothetical protein OsI_23437 [Oryza sativa Indica Group]